MEVVIVWLVRAIWVVVLLPLVIASLPISKLSSFRELVLGFAGRGKILHPSSSSSQLLKLTVPQRFFAHFYVIGVAWTTLLLVATTLVYVSCNVEHRYRVSRALFLLLLMEMQVSRRLFESIFVFRYSPSAKMHLFGYLTGLFFYTAAPFSLCSNIALEVARFVASGKSHTSGLDLDSLLSGSGLMKLEPCQWIGGAVFLWGWMHQRRCHAILGSLRKNPSQAKEYIVPHGDWFEMVSSPHYLAEIVLYVGVLIASGGTDITIWLLLGFVVGNLTMAAGETHQWYLGKFEDYPTNRHAIFPYVY